MGLENNDTAPVISLRGLKKSFGIGDAERFALNGIDLDINKGEFITIMGPSGCGKTSLLNVLGLLSTSSEGEYKINGESVSSISKRRQARIRSQQIGFIFQNFNLIPRLNIVENVAMPLLYRGGMGTTKRLERASELLRNFHLNEREYYMPHQLSGGQVQRVAIARALMNDPTLILADEPTGNLDSQSSHIVMEELADLHRRGNTIIMVTHNPDLTTYASRVITMCDGLIDTDSKDGFKKEELEHKDIFQPVLADKRPLNVEIPAEPETIELKTDEELLLMTLPEISEPEEVVENAPKAKKKSRKAKNNKKTADPKKTTKKSKNKSKKRNKK